MRKGLINTSLYQARIKKGVTRKEAAKHLAISTLRLSLIEKGYLNVPNRRLYFFIHYYNLPDNFFETHSNYVEPYEKDEINFKDLKKKGKKIANKKVRIFAYISIFTSACCVAFGIYANNRRFISPRLPWTENFTRFTEVVKSKAQPKPSVLDGDNVYTFSNGSYSYLKDGNTETVYNAVSVYEKDTNSENTNIDSVITVKDSSDKTIELSYFYLFGSNKKKVVFFYYINYETKITINTATVVISKDNSSYLLRPFQYTENGKSYTAEEGSEAYNKVNAVLGQRLKKAYENIDIFLTANGLVYTKVSALLDDIQKISRDYVLFSRLGISFIAVFSFTGAIFLLLLCLSYYARHQLNNPPPKLCKETKAILNYEDSGRRIYNDIRFPSFIPEFGMRGLGLAILFFSSFTLFASVYTLLNGNFIGFIDYRPFRNMSTNFLSAAVLLLFFIKLDVYSRKNANQLLKNMITLFIAGLIFYIVEVLLFNTILKDGNIFATVLTALIQIIPGNVIWNVMLYSLIFYFLFTTPRKFLNDGTKIIKWRLCSLIPTFILVFALFYKFFFEPRLPTETIYISLMFHTSGIIPTSFAILYLYSLYFFNLMNKFNYGIKDAEVFSYSRRYALYKNIIASIIIVILFAVDMFFRYNIPDNNLKLGKNWSIIFLVPIILLYRPHIGKRPIKWDNIYTILYGSFFAGGYVATAIYILSKLNIAELIYIRF